MGNVIYLGYYGAGKEKRHSSPACNTMMEYIARSIVETGNKVTILSPAQLEENVNREEECVALFDGCDCIFLPSVKRVPSWNVFVRLLNKWKRQSALENKLLSLLQDGDTLMVYHSLMLMEVVKKILQKRKIHLILQVCEVYSDVTNDAKQRMKEIAYVEMADAYIFSSVLLEKELNPNKKPYVICLGQYRPEESMGKKYEDGKIHVVYAGTLDSRKGGAFAAVEAAEYLNSRYEMHILGFGSILEQNALLDKIAATDLSNGCIVRFEGCKQGLQYLEFLQKCTVGLSTQNPDAKYNATSFPSKILVYMANGLRVVCVRIPAVETSDVSPYMYYYDVQEPRRIAQTIMAVDVTNEYDGREAVRILDQQFVKKIQMLFGGR